MTTEDRRPLPTQTATPPPPPPRWPIVAAAMADDCDGIIQRIQALLKRLPATPGKG